jgi:predicted transcriptional regulator of viral defense system
LTLIYFIYEIYYYGMDKFLKKKQYIDKIIESAKEQVMTNIEFGGLVSSVNEIWGLKSISRNEIKRFLIKEYSFIEDEIKGDHSYEIYYRPGTKIDFFDVAAVRSRGSYFSYYSAIYINNLTLQIPKQIYLTLERKSLEHNNNILKQENIDRVFSKPPRVTSNKRNYKNFDINFINGQYQNLIGITKFRDQYAVSDIERTLIDISVRPFYSGGVTQVLEAYVNAKGRLDPQKFMDYYSQLNYTYPYHQVIGFYLEKAGYDTKICNEFLNFDDIEFNFYLTYNILHKEFSKKWRIYYPKGF